LRFSYFRQAVNCLFLIVDSNGLGHVVFLGWSIYWILACQCDLAHPENRGLSPIETIPYRNYPLSKLSPIETIPYRNYPLSKLSKKPHPACDGVGFQVLLLPPVSWGLEDGPVNRGLSPNVCLRGDYRPVTKAASVMVVTPASLTTESISPSWLKSKYSWLLLESRAIPVKLVASLAVFWMKV
jgi:hypothetical protein